MAKAVALEDYYAVLEVSQFASLDSIRDSYKRLALKFHPDKNRGATATADFQLLVRAWETLKDGANRAEYDRNYTRVSKRQRQDGSDERDVNWEEAEIEAECYWAEEGICGSPLTPDEKRKREAVKAWQAIARDDYLSRLRTWTDFRDQRMPRILEIRHILHREETHLNAQRAESDEEITRKFDEAIALTRSAGRNVDPAATLSQLLEARRLWMLRLSKTVVEYRQRLEQLLLELENERRRYEEAEGQARALRIQRALELLGPRNLKTPLFSAIDRRGIGINCWKALSRIGPATKFTAPLGPRDEGPWHKPGEWKRVGGEQTCGRCGQRAFHVIPECSPSQCPGCGMIACINCHRSLRLLQEYEHWVTSPPGSRRDYMFSVLFVIGARPSKVWSSSTGFDGNL